MISESSSTQDVPTHHKKQEYCETRKIYRRGKRKTAVKVFTVNSESKYILVNNVQATGLEKDLLKLCTKYGTVEQCKSLTSYPVEQFTQTFLVKFQDIQAARFAKRGLDNLSFYGTMLHVFYGPEYESVDDTRAKLIKRRIDVVSRIKSLQREERRQNTKGPVKKFPRTVSTGPPLVGYTPNVAATTSEASGDFRNLVTTYTATKVISNIFPSCIQSSSKKLTVQLKPQETLHVDGPMTGVDKSILYKTKNEDCILKLKTPKFIRKTACFKSAFSTSNSGLSNTSFVFEKKDVVSYPAPAFIPRVIQMKLPNDSDYISGNSLLGDLDMVEKLDHTVESEQSDKIDERDYLEHSVKVTAARVRKVLKRTIPHEISYQSSKIKKI